MEQAIETQCEMEALLRSIDVYRPQRDDKKQSGKETLDKAHKFLDGKEMIINAFKNVFFPLPKGPSSF